MYLCAPMYPLCPRWLCLLWVVGWQCGLSMYGHNFDEIWCTHFTHPVNTRYKKKYLPCRKTHPSDIPTASRQTLQQIVVDRPFKVHMSQHTIIHNSIHVQCMAPLARPRHTLCNTALPRQFITGIPNTKSTRTIRSDVTTKSRLARWDEMYPLLSQTLRSVSAAEAQDLVNGGAVLVDVRREDLYDKGHVEGAVSIPMFQNLV